MHSHSDQSWKSEKQYFSFVVVEHIDFNMLLVLWSNITEEDNMEVIASACNSTLRPWFQIFIWTIGKVVYPLVSK